VSLKKAVLTGSGAWVVLIGMLHGGLNLGLFRKAESPERPFKVGFLPVT
jgi:hypothetical protein